jgi:hypothetical protein
VRAALALIVVAACGTDEARLPRLSYLVPAVLAPSCGRNTCHSEAVQAGGYALDTLAHTRTTLAAHPELVVAFDLDRSKLYTVIRDHTMPPDSPLSDADLDLLAQWILDGGPVD